ncbi:MAG: UpxY family transcription antiterminator [Bacteroidota bacterium]
MSDSKWYVAYTHSRSEKKVYAHFQHQALEAYLPLHRIKRQWSDRSKWVEVPLFSSYVFVKTTADRLYALRAIDGVARFLRFEDRFATICESEIEWIKKLLCESEELRVHPQRWVKGQAVRVVSGPLAGLEGTMVEAQNKKRIVVEIKGIAQKLSVSIPADALQPLRAYNNATN